MSIYTYVGIYGHLHMYTLLLSHSLENVIGIKKTNQLCVNFEFYELHMKRERKKVILCSTMYVYAVERNTLLQGKRRQKA